MSEAIAKPGYLGVRRTLLTEPLDDFFFDQSYRTCLGAASNDGSPSAQVVNLDIRRRIAELPLAGMPHLGSGHHLRLERRHRVLASPNLAGRRGQVIDMKTGRR